MLVTPKGVRVNICWISLDKRSGSKSRPGRHVVFVGMAFNSHSPLYIGVKSVDEILCGNLL